MASVQSPQNGLGNWLGPPRFIAFIAIMVILVAGLIDLLPWAQAFLAGFDLAALLFILSTLPLFNDTGAEQMRHTARENDANRFLLLVISAILSLAVLVAIGLELNGKDRLLPADKFLVIGTLAVAWAFGNLVYALHYAHIFYLPQTGGKDRGGIDFPDTDEPDYWDFLYFSFTLGMTFQTSDVDIRSRAVRRIVTLHCAAAFIFNIGVLAFSINVLGGG